MSFKSFFVKLVIPVSLSVFMSIPLQSSEPLTWHQLKSANFNIYYLNDQQGAAVRIASCMEKRNRHIGEFLKYTMPVKLNMYLLFSNSSKSSMKSDIENQDVNNICLYTDYSYKHNSETISEILIKRYLQSLTSELSSSLLMSSNQIDLWLYNALSSYITGSNAEEYNTEMRDLVINRKIKFSSLREQFGGETIQAVRAGFISFTDSVYGREKLIHILKNIPYYGGFQSSLVRVTGEKKEIIFQKFNAYLKSKYPQPQSVQDKRLQGKFDNSDFATISFAAEKKNKKIAVLQKEKYSYRIIMTGKGKEEIIFRFSGNKTSSREISALTFLSENYLAVLLQTDEGSEIKIVNAADGRLFRKVTFPFMYLNSIHSLNNMRGLLFSAETGSETSIYTYSLKNRKLKKISRNNFTDSSPVLADNEKIYYLSKRDQYTIIETDLSGRRERVLLKMKDKIKDLSSSGHELYFSLKDRGVFNIYALDLKTMRRRKISAVNTTAKMPQKLDDRIIYLSYCRGRTVLLETGTSVNMEESATPDKSPTPDDNLAGTSVIAGETAFTHSVMSSFTMSVFSAGEGDITAMPQLNFAETNIQLRAALNSGRADFYASYEYMLPSSKIVMAYRHKDIDLLSENFNLNSSWNNSSIDREPYDQASVQFKYYSNRMIWFGINMDVLNEEYSGEMTDESSLNYLQGGASAGFDGLIRRGFMPESGFNFNISGQYNRCFTEESLSYSYGEFNTEFAYTWRKLITLQGGIASSVYSGGDDDFHRIFISKRAGTADSEDEYFFGERMASFNSEISFNLFNDYLDRPLSGILSTAVLSAFFRGNMIDRSETGDSKQYTRSTGGAMKIQFYPLLFLRLDYIRRIYEDSTTDDELFFMLNFSRRW